MRLGVLAVRRCTAHGASPGSRPSRALAWELDTDDSGRRGAHLLSRTPETNCNVPQDILWHARRPPPVAAAPRRGLASLRSGATTSSQTGCWVRASRLVT